MSGLNKEQVQALFDQESVFFLSSDGVPMNRAVVLFGEQAVGYAKSLAPSAHTWNAFGAGGGTLDYLTLDGFRAAASYYNAQQLTGAEDTVQTREKTELVLTLPEKVRAKNQNTNLNLGLMDDLMSSIRNADSWHAEMMQNPEIRAADKALSGILNEIRGIISDKMFLQIESAVNTYVYAFETAAVLYGIHVANTIRDVAPHPSELSQHILDRITRNAGIQESK